MPSAMMQNQHEPVDVKSAVLMTPSHIDEIKNFFREHFSGGVPVPQSALSDAQFDEIKRLLQPGYELSLFYLNQLKGQEQNVGGLAASSYSEAPATDEPSSPAAPPVDPVTNDVYVVNPTTMSTEDVKVEHEAAVTTDTPEPHYEGPAPQEGQNH